MSTFVNMRHREKHQSDVEFVNLEDNALDDFERINVSVNSRYYQNNPEGLFYLVDKDVKLRSVRRSYVTALFENCLLIFYLVIIFVILLLVLFR